MTTTNKPGTSASIQESPKKYSWATVFDTANDLMIHTFSDRMKVITNIKSGEVKVFRDDEIVNEVNNLHVPTAYEEFLLQIAKTAEELEQFGPKTADGWFCIFDKWPEEGRPVNGRYDACPWEPRILWRHGMEFYSNCECDIEFKEKVPDSWRYVYDKF